MIRYAIVDLKIKFVNIGSSDFCKYTLSRSADSRATGRMSRFVTRVSPIRDTRLIFGDSLEFRELEDLSRGL